MRRATASRLSRRPVRVREQRFVGVAGAFGEPDPQQRSTGCGERDGALFAAFAVAADVGAGAEGDVVAVQAE